ncbi:hypothetical protein OF83DRAFT_260394 [Amylostereum chailletii]|nr:hypothetical protein OF83DRAFT_260394 [Amylostereum chailletii]
MLVFVFALFWVRFSLTFLLTTYGEGDARDASYLSFPFLRHRCPLRLSFTYLSSPSTLPDFASFVDRSAAWVVFFFFFFWRGWCLLGAALLLVGWGMGGGGGSIWSCRVLYVQVRVRRRCLSRFLYLVSRLSLSLCMSRRIFLF